MNVSKRWLVVLTWLFFGLFFGIKNQALAATQTPQGLTVSPAYQQVSVAADKPEHPLTFSLTNNTLAKQTIKLSIADFNTLDETGGLFFEGANPTELQKKYGLASWVSLPETAVTIGPKQTVSVKAVIFNQASLAPGGHYGALMLSLVTENGESKANTVGFQPIASALLFVNKVGGDIHSLSLDKVNKPKNVFALPSVVTLHFRNQGNTHVLPRGTVEIRDPGGRLNSKGIINQDSAIILPQLSRQFQVKLSRLALPERPGHYQLLVNYRFDGYPNYKTYQKSLLLLTPLGLIIFAGALSGLLGLAYLFNKNRLPQWLPKWPRN